MSMITQEAADAWSAASSYQVTSLLHWSELEAKDKVYLKRPGTDVAMQRTFYAITRHLASMPPRIRLAEFVEFMRCYKQAEGEVLAERVLR